VGLKTAERPFTQLAEWEHFSDSQPIFMSSLGYVFMKFMFYSIKDTHFSPTKKAPTFG
jgi:hypothetical protein